LHRRLTAETSLDLGKDIQARHEGEEHYGYETWFSGHRNGESGINNPGTEDINGEICLCLYSQDRLCFEGLGAG
jgi:hypothetical protein